ncbi:MAG TPA: zinc-dependent metalloprotease [Acidimicrobiia bacterium]|jgi:putative hydrolase|nr:zinc-dependent metalloprotease [Acidimicrobiia bacterium]
MLRFLQSDGPVHWEVARQVARWVALEGEGEPTVAADDRARLAEVAQAAEQRVLAETGEAPPSFGLSLLGRAEWADQALVTLRPVLERLAVSLQGDLPDLAAGAGDAAGPPDGNPFAGLFGLGMGPGAGGPGGPGDMGANPMAGMAGMLGALGPLLLGVQCGFMVGQLAQGLLSEHDLLLPIADPPRPTLIVPNLEAFHAAWSIPADDLRFYLSLGEAVRSRIVARPWVRERLVRLASEYVSSFRIDTSAMEAQLGSIDLSDPSSFEGAMVDPDAMLGAMQSPEQLVVLERFQGTTAVLETYADSVVERLAEPMIKSLPTIREAMRRHRVERSEADRFIQRLLGLDPSRRLHDQAAAFCRGVEERAGTPALDRLLEAESMLPTPAELEAPGLWLARIELFGGEAG